LPSAVHLSQRLVGPTKHLKQTNKKINGKLNKVKNLNWLEANQLAIYKRSRGFELVPDHREQTQLKVGADYKSNALNPGHATKIDQFVSLEMVVMFIHADTII